MRWTIIVVLCGLSTIASMVNLIATVRASYSIAKISDDLLAIEKRHETERSALSEKIKQLQSDLTIERMRPPPTMNPGF